MAAIAEKANTSPVPSRDDDGGDGLTHLWCCDENVAHCGANISDSRPLSTGEVIAGSPECVVCDDLDDNPCPRGCEWRQ